ncbi:MAG: FRG domain-containing protein, partial [Candidatus Methanoperedens sp.]
AYSEVKEKNELKKFIQESDSNPKYNDLEWLTLAQHYDVPTRLLDWTEDPFVALWFACNGKKINNDSSRIVWGFLINLNELPDINFEKPLELKKKALFKHNPIDKRMIAQNAWFTVHYFDDDFKWCDALENEKQVKKKLFKFKLTISETLRNEFLKELDKMGINSFSLFPD